MTAPGGSPARRTFDVDSPCPKCGRRSILGYAYTNDAGAHQHTYYVCTSWPSGEDRCGWNDWSVRPEREEVPATDL